jgi:hypothetical protein
LHALLKPHAESFVPLPTLDISDDEYTHSDHGSGLNSKSNLKYDEHVDHDHADVEPP